MVSLWSSHTPCMGLWFSHAFHGLVVLVCPVWVRCSCSVCHTRYGLVAVFLHYLYGLIVLTCLVWAHCSCWGWLVAAPVVGREVDLWREVIFNYDLMRFDTASLVRSSSLYHPRRTPIFHCTAKSKQERKHKGNQTKKSVTRHNSTDKTSDRQFSSSDPNTVFKLQKRGGRKSV